MLKSTMNKKGTNLVHNLDSLQSKKGFDFPTEKWPVIFFAVMLLGGLFSGYALMKKKTTGPDSLIEEGIEVEIVDGKKIFGSQDKKVFKDNAVGVLEKGGIKNEGTHHLQREGGESQTAYLTSSVINLNKFVGRKVKVWGETFQGQEAGWLMDVGRIELLE